jgi:3-ketosteroid 9alpha-monooxygenase subunit B
MANQANDEIYHSLRIREVVEETDDSKSLVFEVPATAAEAFRYRPGQFLTLRIPYEGRHLLRCYSLASCPLTDDAPRVTVKRVIDGRASNWICDRLKAGDSIEVKPPAGHFTPRSLNADFLFFAGGSGITPIMSIIKSALVSGHGRLFLIYANRDERSVIFRDALNALVRAHPTRLQIVQWLDSVQGIPLAANLGQLSKPFSAADCYICGPEAFMETALMAVRALGLPPSRVHVERFVSLPDEEDAAPETAAPAADEEIQLEVELDGVHHEIRCSRSEPLLNAMLRAGLKAPHSCRAGACATCMCTLEAGEVHLRNNQVLDKNDLAQGWILACQALADTPSVRVRFPD